MRSSWTWWTRQLPPKNTQTGLQPRLHPNIADVYRQKVADLERALGEPGDGTAALEALRSLIERMTMHPRPDGEGLEVELVGDLGAMVALGLGARSGGVSALDRDLFSRSVKVVAGTCNPRRLGQVSVPC